MSFQPGLWRILRVTVLALFAAMAAHAEEGLQDAWSYQLGRGLRLGDSGLWLGGYASVKVEDYRHQAWRAHLSDLSLFVGWEKGPWRFFSEFELGDALGMGNGEALSTQHGYFDLERLYLDYVHADALQARFGKFLTPIGRWNQIHAAPLIWTTSKPMIVEGPFPMHVSGGMIHGTVNALDKLWSYAVYGGGGGELDFKSPDESRDDNFRDIAGFRLYHGSPGQVQFGLSYAHYSDRVYHPGAKNLVGVDVFWTRKRYEISGEFAYRFGGGSSHGAFDFDEPGANHDLWGLYLQGVAPLVGNLFAVGRFETFQREGATSPGYLWLGGLAYRPVPPMVFKVEYSFGRNTGDLFPSKDLGGFSEGFAASFAVLF